MSEANPAQTKTVSRTTVEVQEVEETMYLCNNCDQGYEKEEIVTVAVDVDEDGDMEEERQLCVHCSETFLDYSPTESVREYVSRRTASWSAEDYAKSAISTAIAGAILLGGIAALIGAGGMMVDALAQFMAASSGEASTTADTAKAMEDLIGAMVPIVLIIAFSLPLVKMMAPSGGERL